MKNSSPFETLAILLAAGRGSRAGGHENKIFGKIGAGTLLECAARPLLEHPGIGSLIVVAAPGEKERVGSILSASFPDQSIQLVAGGGTRQASSLLGLRAAFEMSAGDGRTIVLIHDAARCFLEAETITELIGTIRQYHCGAAPAVTVDDTIRLLDESGSSIMQTMPRERLVAMQTPQGADLPVLLRAAELAEAEKVEVTDDLELLLRIGYPVRLIKGRHANRKITRPEDFMTARLPTNPELD